MTEQLADMLVSEENTEKAILGGQRGRRPVASSPNVRINWDKKEVRRHEECIRAREEDEKGHEKEAEMMNQEKGNRNGKEK